MFLLIDKPKGMTSHDVVDVVRNITGERRVGHAGTLDPNATGLLIVGVGREETKKLGEVSKNTRKEYQAEVVLGEERDTDDSEGGVIFRNDEIIPSKADVREILTEFIGNIEQIPPAYSAIKVRGKKSYQVARKGKKIVLKPRKVRVYSIELTSYKYPVLNLRCEVSSGTYIRAIARDIGKKLGCGAYLRNLRRTGIGKYRLDEAVKIEDL